MKTLLSIMAMLLWIILMSPVIVVGFAYYHVKAAVLVGTAFATRLDKWTL